MTSEQVWGEHAAKIYEFFCGSVTQINASVHETDLLPTRPRKCHARGFVSLYCKLIKINGEMVDFDIVLLVGPLCANCCAGGGNLFLPL